MNCQLQTLLDLLEMFKASSSRFANISLSGNYAGSVLPVNGDELFAKLLNKTQKILNGNLNTNLPGIHVEIC